MASIYLRLSSKADKITSKSEILIRFKHGKIDLRTKSGLYVHGDNWNIKKQKVIIPNSRILNDLQRELVETDTRITELTNLISNNFLSADLSQVNREWLDTLVDNFLFPSKVINTEDNIETFIYLFNEFIVNHNVSKARKQHYKVVYRALQRYEKYINKTEDRSFKLHIDEVTNVTLASIEDFLRDEHTIILEYPDIYDEIPETRTPQPRGQNTLNGIISKIRTFFIWAMNQEKTINNPFRKFTIKECVYGTPFYISIDERNMLHNTDISHKPKLEIQRDIFIFQCLIGCRIGDLYKMTQASIINGAIEYIPRKTKEGRAITVRVPLNNIAQSILEKYKDIENSYLFPFISEQKYNIAIKKMFEMVGLTRMVTIVNPTTGDEEKRPINEIASSHLARRCFIGNLYKKVKDPNLVGSLSGHKEGSKAFARYREIDEQMKIDLIKLLD